MGKIPSAKRQLKKVKKEMYALHSALAEKRKQIRHLKEETQKLSSTVAISDHAFIRYFERVKGFDLEEVRKEILSPKVSNLIDTFGGNGQFPNDGFSVVLKNNIVVTII